jgi:hypothetical protein
MEQYTYTKAATVIVILEHQLETLKTMVLTNKRSFKNSTNQL